MRRLQLSFGIVLISFVFAASVAQATPIAYGLQFQVQYIGCNGCGFPPLDPRVHIGSTYFGSFVIDDSILSVDGINKAGSVSAFRIQMEEAVWDNALPSPLSLFDGFRGPGGLGVSSPGFDVVGGKIVNVRGGVFGAGDFPFVDFSTDLRVAGDPSVCGPGSQYCGNAPSAFWSRNPLGEFGGSMLVFSTPIPEPATVVLFGFAVLGWLLMRCRRLTRPST